MKMRVKLSRFKAFITALDYTMKPANYTADRGMICVKSADLCSQNRIEGGTPGNRDRSPVT